MPFLGRCSAPRSWWGPWCSSLASPCSLLVSHINLYRPLELCCTEYLYQCLSYLGPNTVGTTPTLFDNKLIYGPTLSLESLTEFSTFQFVHHPFTEDVLPQLKREAEAKLKLAVRAGPYLGNLIRTPLQIGCHRFTVRRVKQIPEALTQKWDKSQIFIIDLDLALNFVHFQAFWSRDVLCAVQGYCWLGAIAGGLITWITIYKSYTVFHSSSQREIKSSNVRSRIKIHSHVRFDIDLIWRFLSSKPNPTLTQLTSTQSNST